MSVFSSSSVFILYVHCMWTVDISPFLFPFSGNHKQKFYFGHKEIMVPGKQKHVYT